jgi:hypothetical protein
MMGDKFPIGGGSLWFKYNNQWMQFKFKI